ncbi:MAG: helix-hairpin-helix domain-containing protein [Acholeplasmatales bacterium]|nr:helix-hairpin-helix domain-containing protein [Acholeplasmatales bacterium]
MYKKKEIIIIIAIIFITILLSSFPILLNNNKTELIQDDDEIIEESNIITITVTGELTIPGDSLNPDTITNTINIEATKGISYGEIITKINNYLTSYSIINDSFKTRYYTDTTIIIESSFIDETKEEDNQNKIDISEATFDELMMLYGIGEKRALAIIEYRINNPIESFEELKSLLGVSDEVIERIKEKALL